MKKLFVLVFILSMSISGLAYSKETKHDRIAIADDSVQGGRGGFFISLDENKVIPIIERYNMETKTVKKEKITADLWVEPDDPEVMTFDGDGMDRFLVKGTTSKLSRIFSNYEDIKFLPSGITWKQGLLKENIKKGTVFLVHSVKKNIYKVRIDHVSKSIIQITYSQL